WKAIPNSDGTRSCFSPDSRRILFAARAAAADDAGDVIYRVAPESPQQPIEVARVEKEVIALHCADSAGDVLLVEEHVFKERSSWSSTDPVRFWSIDGRTGERTQLTGPWCEAGGSFAEAPCSKDGRF